MLNSPNVTLSTEVDTGGSPCQPLPQCHPGVVCRQERAREKLKSTTWVRSTCFRYSCEAKQGSPAVSDTRCLASPVSNAITTWWWLELALLAALLPMPSSHSNAVLKVRPWMCWFSAAESATIMQCIDPAHADAMQREPDRACLWHAPCPCGSRF
jgi:hypothetical protein